MRHLIVSRLRGAGAGLVLAVLLVQTLALPPRMCPEMGSQEGPAHVHHATAADANDAAAGWHSAASHPVGGEQAEDAPCHCDSPNSDASHESPSGGCDAAGHCSGITPVGGAPGFALAALPLHVLTTAGPEGHARTDVLRGPEHPPKA